MSTTAREPAFTVSVDGNAIIPHMAERANINVYISNTGLDKATVSEEVLSDVRQVESFLKDIAPADDTPAAKEDVRQVESFLKDIAPADDTPAAKEASPLAYWTKTSMSLTSYMQGYTDEDKKHQQRRTFTARIDFDIRFKEFRALGAFISKLSPLACVEVKDMQWDLTAATKDRFRSELRRRAALDAVAKAQDYCRALNCTNLQPTAVRENGGGLQASSKAKASFSSSHANRGQFYGNSVQAYAARPQTSRFLREAAGDDSSDEEEALALEFEPQELRMNLSVTVDFQADPSPLDQLDTSSTKATSDPDSAEAFEHV